MKETFDLSSGNCSILIKLELNEDKVSLKLVHYKNMVVFMINGNLFCVTLRIVEWPLHRYDFISVV